jgi:hypothetical protein
VTSVEEPFAQRLDAFLAARGATRGALLATVGEPFGPPLLVVAAGSILHGFGNQRSDIDVNVVVDRDVTRLPITAYSNDVMIDTKYFAPAEVDRWVTTLRDWPRPPQRLDRDQWAVRLAAVINCTRFGHGLILSAQDAWQRWATVLREPWLAASVAEWWSVESIRRQVAADWLADRRPLLAAQRRYEAILAAFESRAAAAGQLHYGAKWIAEKLRRIGDRAALDALRSIMRAPISAAEAADYLARCVAILDEFHARGQSNLAAQLWYLPGVAARELDARTFVTRWGMRGIELRGSTPRVPKAAEPIWQGEIGDRPPSNILSLFTDDMLWLSIVGTTS